MNIPHMAESGELSLSAERVVESEEEGEDESEESGEDEEDEEDNDEDEEDDEVSGEEAKQRRRRRRRKPRRKRMKRRRRGGSRSKAKKRKGNRKNDVVGGDKDSLRLPKADVRKTSKSCGSNRQLLCTSPHCFQAHLKEMVASLALEGERLTDVQASTYFALGFLSKIGLFFLKKTVCA